MGRFIIAVALLAVGCVRALPPSLAPTEVISYSVVDGRSGSLRHYAGDGPAVLLVHGMGANHYNWDYREEVSLADYLQQAGWDVWVVEMPETPTTDFDDYAQNVLPEAVDAVLNETDSEKLFWVGHSLGGMLLYTAMAQYPEKLAGGVTICSTATFTHQSGVQKTLQKVPWVLKGDRPVRIDKLARTSGVLRRNNPAYKRISNRKNMMWPVALGMAKHAVVAVPRPVARQALGWTITGELTNQSGQPWLDPETDVPVLAFGATSDRVVSNADAKSTCAALPNCTYEQLDGYGHVDPIVGKSARKSVYPVIEQWLSETDSHRSP